MTPRAIHHPDGRFKRHETEAEFRQRRERERRDEWLEKKYVDE